jgi:TolB-like protein
MADSFFTELKRRNVFRVGIAYLVAAWVLAQVADLVADNFNAPDWGMQLLLIVLGVGFVIALGFAWAFEITPEGIKKESEVDRSNSVTPLTGRKLDRITIILLGVALAYFIWESRFQEDSEKIKSVASELSGSEVSSNEEQSLDAAPNLGGNSIAIIPFENMSGDEANNPFTIGIHDDLLTQVSKIGSLKTISRTSVLRYQNTDKSIPEIGRELGVATILEGGVQRVGNRVRINMQLIDCITDEHLWAETYDRELTASNIFAIQSEIASSVAAALKATLSIDEQTQIGSTATHNLTALDAYYLGKQLWYQRTAASLKSSVEYFEQAIAADPEFARAYAGLAVAWMVLPEYETDLDLDRVREKSRAAAVRSLELVPDLTEGLFAMAWSRMIHDYDWIEAERLLLKALERAPTNEDVLHWISHVASWQGRHEDALAWAQKAVDAAPLSALLQNNLAYISGDASDFVAMEHHMNTALQLNPGYVAARRNRWQMRLRAGNLEQGVESLVTWAVGRGRAKSDAEQVAELIIQYARTGVKQELPDELADRLAFGPENLGLIYAFLGDKENTLRSLEQAFEERSGSRSVLSIKINSAYDFVRDEPRFQVLLVKTNLAD